MKDNATESLVACLLEMAETETNPVLKVISTDIPLQENKKYPSGLLQFSQTGWRAYYHCHPASRAGNHRFKGEHGHFHIFVRTQNDPDKWSHMVALAMDNMGQPLGWFTVNHWVTGEEWESARVLVEYLKATPYNHQSSLVECWLLSLLSVSSNDVSMILYERDNVLNKKKIMSEGNDIKMDKKLYLLSETQINLKELLGINNNNL